MRTAKTIEEARATRTPDAVAIIEIEHATDGHCYIGCRASMSVLAAAIAANPIPEIIRLIAEHPALSAAEIAERDARLATEHDRHLREDIRCDRCHRHVDGHAAYSQMEWGRLGNSRVRVRAYYCGECRSLLAACGQGEATDIDHRAAATPDMTPATKQD